MEVSALRYSGGIGLHARSPLLRLQSDERLVALIRRGNSAAFEVMVSRYHARLLAFCRHLLGSREDAEDVLQEVFSAAFNAILDDDRPINVRPWLYRIARNRSLNHLRRIQAIGVDSMDIHLHDHGATTADKVYEREEFRLLVGDIQSLPETQRTALVLREMDALSYEQIAEAMETTVPSVKSLLVRARVSLAEAAEARMLSCEEVRMELGEVAEGLRRRPGTLVRRHLRTCERCSTFKAQLNETSKALTALLPIGFAPLVLLRKLAILHLGHSAGAGSSASGASAAGQAAAVGSTAAAGATAVAGSTGGGFLTASVGAIATKAAAGLATAALVTAGAVEVDHTAHHPHARPPVSEAAALPAPATPATPAAETTHSELTRVVVFHRHAVVNHAHKAAASKSTGLAAHKTPVKPPTKATGALTKTDLKGKAKGKAHKPAGRTQTQTDSTVLAQPTTPAVTPTPVTSTCTDAGGTSSTTSTAPTTTTTTTTAGPSSDAGAGGASTTSTTASPSADTTTSPPPASGSSSCAADSGSSAGQPAQSGGVAP